MFSLAMVVLLTSVVGRRSLAKTDELREGHDFSRAAPLFLLLSFRARFYRARNLFFPPGNEATTVHSDALSKLSYTAVKPWRDSNPHRRIPK